jgi:hypothetical protein
VSLLCSHSSNSFTDPISSQVFLSHFILDQHLAEFLAGYADLSLLADYVHEYTHHACGRSIVYSNLHRLYLRATQDSATYVRPEQAADCIKLAIATNLLRPWAEGIAMYAQLDALPQDDGEHMSNVSSEVLRRFTIGREHVQQLLKGGDVSQHDVLEALRMTYVRYRFSEHGIRDKVALLSSPLSIDHGGYLAGYLAVRNAITLFREHAPQLQDSDFALLYMQSLIFDDPAIAECLLSRHLTPVEAANEVTSVILNHSNFVLSVAFRAAVAADVDHFEKFLDDRPDVDPYGVYIHFRCPTYTDEATYERFRSAFEAELGDEREGREDRDDGLILASRIMVTGITTGQAIFEETGKTFVFDYGDDRTAPQVGGTLRTPGSYPASMAHFIIPFEASGETGCSISIDDRVENLALPAAARGTALEHVLQRYIFQPDGLLSDIARRNERVSAILKSAAEGSDVTAAVINAAHHAGAAVFADLALIIHDDSDKVRPLQTQMWHTGFLSLFGGDHSLMKAFASLSTMINHSFGVIGDTPMTPVWPDGVDLKTAQDKLLAIADQWSYPFVKRIGTQTMYLI